MTPWQAPAQQTGAASLRSASSVLGVAAGGAPVMLAVGTVDGAALVPAAARTRSRPALTVLVSVGTVPFAALVWTALVQVLLLLAAWVVTVPLLHHPAPAPPAAPSRTD